MNFSKENIPVMFAGTAEGEMLAPYVVYKAENLWQSWCSGGPEGTRFNRSRSGWMNGNNFNDWFLTVVVPWARRRESRKVIIGDTLSSRAGQWLKNVNT
ncbi:Pogo transposable element with KRAB domain [Elysia marginata]|uniref:Pogo transposable element with KRAB domain n=1 Tax=Elysia marginata TaxID=1093978 RepID=A0AAV4JKR5_9GAST|nr:Pogo transposable element with KRAB domain [Elysia marginata]